MASQRRVAGEKICTYQINGWWHPEHFTVWVDKDVALVTHFVVAISTAIETQSLFTSLLDTETALSKATIYHMVGYSPFGFKNLVVFTIKKRQQQLFTM